MGKGCTIFSKCILITKTTFPFALELILDGRVKTGDELIYPHTPMIKVIMIWYLHFQE